VTAPLHPRDALFEGEKPFPSIAACEHFAGSEERIVKALALQKRPGPVFDVTCDCEDGARPGAEKQHAEMVAHLVSGAGKRQGRIGARLHDPSHQAWKNDLEILLHGAGDALDYVVIPKIVAARQAGEAIDAIARVAKRPVPVHLLIETHGALRDVHALAALPGVETLDFGLMDFVSAHHGAIPATALRSPGQFENQLVARAKGEIASAALAHGVVPSHNVTLDFRNPDTAYQDARRAREEYGYLRMWSIHPAQIPPIVDAMKPGYEEVQAASEILLAAQQAGWGPIQHHGEMHDRATYRLFWNRLQSARQTGVPLPEAAEKAFFA
jgi:citrate lyase subunit beta/citryl-CoA lyase